MNKNKLSKLLQENKPSFKYKIAWYMVCYYRYVPWTIIELESFSRAVEFFDMPSMIKIYQNNKAFMTQ